MSFPDFTQATIVTVEDNASAWSWLDEFQYRVIVHKGISKWIDWIGASQLSELIERLGLRLEDVLGRPEPSAAPQEFNLRDNVVLVSA